MFVFMGSLQMLLSKEMYNIDSTLTTYWLKSNRTLKLNIEVRIEVQIGKNIYTTSDYTMMVTLGNSMNLFFFL